MQRSSEKQFRRQTRKSTISKLDFQKLEPREMLAYDLANSLYPTTQTSDFHFEGFSVAANDEFHITGKPGFALNGSSSGAIEFYDAQSNAHILTLPNPAPDSLTSFGRTMALDGDRLAVGANGGVTVFDLSSGSPIIEASFPNPDPNNQNGFGISALDLSGDILVVGGPNLDNGNIFDEGAAYVFDIGSGSTAPLATLDNPTPATFDYFGYSVAVESNTVFVGAFGNDEAGSSNIGGVYTYEIVGGQAQPGVTLFSPDTTTSRFGEAVTANENFVAISSADNQVHVFDNSSPSYPWFDSVPNPNVGIDFGADLALDGTTLVASDPSYETSTGVVNVFDIGTSDVSLRYSIFDTTPETDGLFGDSVSVFENTILIGNQADSVDGPFSGSAYVYDVAGNAPVLDADLSQTFVDRADFGSELASSGNLIFVGAPLDGLAVSRTPTSSSNGLGEVYVYHNSNGTAEFLSVIENPVATNWSGFGTMISASEDYLAITGSSGFGNSPGSAVSIYELVNNTPEYRYSIETPLSSIEVIGDQLFLSDVFSRFLDSSTSANFAGSVKVFDLSQQDTTPRDEFFSPTPETNQRFGSSLQSDGNRLVVGNVSGATADGNLYVYDIGGVIPQHEITIPNPTPANFDFFGSASAIEGDWLIGSSYRDRENGVSGAVYSFDLNSGSAAPVETVSSPNANTESFGQSLTFSNGRIAIGALSNSSNFVRTVFVYDFDFGNMHLNDSLISPSTQAFDGFGSSLLLHNEQLFVAAEADGFAYNGAGAVHVYKEAVPQLRLTSPGEVDESDGITGAVFSIDLLSPASTDVTFDYATVISVGDNAIPGADFMEVSGTATIAAGETSFQVMVPINGDDYLEGDESFSLVISNPDGAEIETGQASVSVIDDETFTLGQQLDFGTNFSDVTSGDVGFEQTQYSPELGLGWLPGVSDLSTIERPRGNTLLRDLAQLRSGEFVVDVPDAQYRVTVNLGAILRGGDNMRLTIEGQIFNLQPTAGPNVVVQTLVSNVADGQLNFEFNGLGLLPFFRVAGLQIEEVANRNFSGKSGLTSQNTIHQAATNTEPFDSRISNLLADLRVDGNEQGFTSPFRLSLPNSGTLNRFDDFASTNQFAVELNDLETEEFNGAFIADLINQLEPAFD